MNKIFIGLCILLLFSSCDSEFRDIGGGYQYGWIDLKYTADVSYKNSPNIFRNTVYEVSYSDSLIIAKVGCTRTNIDSFYNEDYKPCTLNYVIDKNKYKNDLDQMNSEGVMGPVSNEIVDSILNESEFKKLSIDDFQ